MVATNDQFPLKKQTSPKGVSGIEISGGVYNEDYLQKLQGVRWAIEADKMRTQDSQVKMILNSVRNPILSATWEFTAADANDDQSVQHRDFIEFILTCDMLRPWNTFINEVLSFIPFGHSVFEIIHKNVANHPKFGNYTGIKVLSWRSAKTLEEWQLDLKTGELEAILQRSSGDFTNDATIPASFLLIFTLDQEGNYFASTSRAWLRPVYGNYLLKQFLRKLKAIGHEKMTVGTPVGTVPAGASEADERKFELILQRYTSNENSYIKLPEEYKIEILRGKFDANGIELAIEAENNEMVRSFLANFLNLGQGTASSSGGSFALGADLSDFFLKGIQYVADLICDVINNRLIPHVIDLNFGEQAEYPKLICSGVQDVGKELSEIIANYANVGAVQVDDTLRKFLRKLHKLPPEDMPEEGTEPIEIIPEPAPTTAAPAQTTPNPTANEPDVSTDTQVTSDIIPATELQMTGRGILTKGAQGLEEVMALNLDFIANKLQADIVNRFKNLPEGRKRTATVRIKPGGVNKYKKDLRATLTNLGAIAINEAQKEAGIAIQKFADPLDIAVDIASGVAKARFPKLPRGAKDKILVMAEDLANAHATDLEKAAKFAANNTIETTNDEEILAQDIKEATNAKSKQLLNSAPISSASELVNAVRLEVFLTDESKAAGNVGFQFFNPSPVSLICQNLAGRIFSNDNKDAARNFPPLHFNCKSTLIPIKAASPKAAKIDDDLGLEIVASSPEEFNRIKSSVQFNDSQILQLLADVQLTLTFQTFLFDRKIYSRGQAVQWASMRAFSTVDVEELDRFIAIRQRNPEEFKEGSLTKIQITQGVKAIAGDLLADFLEPMPLNDFMQLQDFDKDFDVISITFDKDFISNEKAMQFIRDRGFETGEVEDSDNILRIRICDPGECVERSIRGIRIQSGVTAVIGKRKKVFSGHREKDRKLHDAFHMFLLQESTTVQTLIFDKKNWTRARSVQWAKDHDFRSDKVDETPTSFRLRQRNPGDFQAGSFRTIDITTGLKAVIGRLKNA